jgi:hypothetical protein
MEHRVGEVLHLQVFWAPLVQGTGGCPWARPVRKKKGRISRVDLSDIYTGLESAKTTTTSRQTAQPEDRRFTKRFQVGKGSVAQREGWWHTEPPLFQMKRRQGQFHNFSAGSHSHYCLVWPISLRLRMQTEGNAFTGHHFPSRVGNRTFKGMTIPAIVNKKSRDLLKK